MSVIARYDDTTGNVVRDDMFETNHEGQHEWRPGGEGEVSRRGLKAVSDCHLGPLWQWGYK